jgi:hypothetical protein
MSIEVLSMLSIKSVNYTGEGGGKPSVTWEMVSQVLAKLPDHISAYARMKYNGEYRGEGYGTHFHITLDAVRSLSGCLDIQMRMRADMFMNMTRTALMESICDGDVCPSCKGNQQVISKNSYRMCSTCEGSGRLSFKNGRIAKLVGYSDVRSYQRYGKPFYTRMLNEIQGGWETRIHRECSKMLRE